MSTVAEHYAKHLGPIYLWMAGAVLKPRCRPVALRLQP